MYILQCEYFEGEHEVLYIVNLAELKTLRCAHTVCSCVLCASRNIQ